MTISPLPAQVVLNLTATSPSATQITITAGSGTNTVAAGGVTQATGGAARLPVGTSWSGSSANWQMVGLNTSFSSSNFQLVSSTLRYTHNGSAFGEFLNQIETYQQTVGFQFRIGPSSSMTFNAMSAGDTYGFTGTATFNLTGGMTAAAFTNGTFDNPINGGNFSWAVAVPEPSTYALVLGIFSALLLLLRRRFLRNRSSSQALA